MPTAVRARSASPGVVGIAAWVLPGAGYLIIGEKARAAVIGPAILILFALGILVGGIRVMDPPGWGEYGYRTMMVDLPQASAPQRIDPKTPEMEAHPLSDHSGRVLGWSMVAEPTAELGNKPWFVGQILCGPITLLASTTSVHEAKRLEPANPNAAPSLARLPGVVDTVDGVEFVQVVPSSHARSWEIGTLYTAVAGMLNLLAIIDSVHRANQKEEA